MIDIANIYNTKLRANGDISQHLPYLKHLASNCETILECGVRSVVSSWAFLNGLVNNNSNAKLIHLCDIDNINDNRQFETACKENNVEFNFYQCNDLYVPFKNYDMVFIDTWHVYGHLKRELEKFSKMATKYIVMHDTEVDKIYGETIRVGWNAEEQSRKTGIPVEEIRKGLQPAIDEFLAKNSDWVLDICFIHNNGLTVLKKKV